MGEGNRRNSLCWCGSGKKYKKCHLDRENQDRDTIWPAAEENRRAFSRKICFAKNTGLGECEGKIIKAHSVSRGPNLSKIADDGHVMRYNADIAQLMKTKGNIYAEKVGIKDASIFYGYCQKHDREIFSNIENEEFIGRPDQCLTAYYRTLSRELYGKDSGAHLRETARVGDKGLSPFDQFMFQQILDDIHTGNEAARRELKATHDILTGALSGNAFQTVESLLCEFENTLPFAFSGAWSPFTDIHGHELQYGYSDTNLEQVCFTSHATSQGTVICISWKKKNSSPGEAIANQIMAIPNDMKASIILQFVIKHVENIFFNPRWFTSLSSPCRLQLDKLAKDGVDYRGSVPEVPIRHDLNFKLPKSNEFKWVK